MTTPDEERQQMRLGIAPSGLHHLRIGMGEHWEIQRAGMVYYLQRADGPIKIGCTINYRQRRNDLVQRHGSLWLLAWEPGYYTLEQQRHQQFADLRIKPIAEWFRPGTDLVDHLLCLAALR